MTVGCNQWPMTELTVPKGSKRRVMRCHPQEALPRTALGFATLKGGKKQIRVNDPDAIKLPPGKYWAEEKMQGHRYVYSRDASGRYCLHPRGLNVEGRYTERFGQIDQCMDLPPLPVCTACDCELYVPGEPDSYVSTAIANGLYELRLCVFAIPIYKGKWMGDLSYLAGRRLIERALPPSCWQHWVDELDITESHAAFALENLLIAAKQEGEEGAVLKGRHYSNWWKIKLIHEADVCVIGFKVSEAETREGLITAVRVGVYTGRGSIRDVGSVSGFDLSEMRAMTKAYEAYGSHAHNKYYKKVLRVVYQERAAQGGMKHGFFDCWRDDKGALDCTVEQFDERA